MSEKNKDCPCTNKGCPRNGNCEECKAHHRSRGIKTACEREKK